MPGKKHHPLRGYNPYDLRVRPNVFKPFDFDEAIERHGQDVRWIKAQPCPVLTEYSQHDLHCKVCHGRGEIYEYQREYWHYHEESPHGLKDPMAGQADKVVFFDSPVLTVGRISQLKNGSIIDFDVVSHDELSAIIAPPAGHCLPEYYETILSDYAIDLWEKFSVIIPQGSSILELPFDKDQFITKLDLVRYEDKSENIKVHSFNVRTVYLDKVPTKPVEVRGYKSRCAIMALMPFESMTAMQWKQYPHSEGDMVALCSDSYKVGKGDIITSMYMTQRSPEVMVRTDGDFDVIPYYDIQGIDGKIVDSKGVEYENGVDFVVWDYNKIKWVGNTPEKGAQYSANIIERVTWRVHTQFPSVNVAQNRVFPNSFHLKKLTKNNPGTLQPGLKNEEAPVGDWSKKFNFQ